MNNEQEKIDSLFPYVAVAGNAFRNHLPRLSAEERVLIITDSVTDPNQQDLAEIAQEVFLQLGHRVNRTGVDKDFTADEAEKVLENHEVIFNVSQLAHRGTLFSLLGRAGNRGARIISPIGATKEMFAPNGPLDGGFDQLSERLFKLEYLLKEAVGLRITTPYGTNLKIPLRPGRKWAVTSGVIQPGNWDNMTGTEVGITPDEFKTKGILVLFAIDNESSQQEPAVDEPVVLKIKGGLIVSIKGGILATKLRHQFQTCAIKEILEGRNPLNVYRIAEVGLPGKTGSWPLKETPTVMAEKSMPHLGFGSSQHGEEGADGFFYVNSHLDELVPTATISVYRNQADFKRVRHGKQIMQNGLYTFI